MPTITPYADDRDLDDDNFASGLANDVRNQISPDDLSTPTPAPAAVTPAVQQPALPPPPAYTPPDRTDLNKWEQAYETDSKALDRNDPALKPKWWERGLGGIAAGLMAYGRNPNAIAEGETITDRRYNNAEQQRQGRLAQDTEGIKAAQSTITGTNQDWENQNRAYQSGVTARRFAQLDADRAAQEQQRLQAIAPGTETPDDAKNPLGTWHATTVGGKTVQMSGPPEKWLKTPAGTAAQREADVQRLNLTGDDAKYYRANGKLKEPGQQTHIHIPSAESQEYNDWRSTFKKENGREPNAQDIQAYRKGEPKEPVATPGQIEEMAGKRDKAYQDLEEKYSALRDAETTDEGRARVDSEREDAKKKLNTEWDQRFSAADPSGKYAGGGRSAAPQQQPQATQVKAGTVKIGDPVTDGKRQGTVVGISANGKPQVQWR